MAFTHIDFFNGDGERIFARGSHTKYIANAFKDVSFLIILAEFFTIKLIFILGL